MKSTILLLAYIICGAVNPSVHATGQQPDILVYKDKTYELLTNPLESLYKKDHSNRPKFMAVPNGMSSGNWRGYIAKWKIENGKLYLTGIESWLCDQSIPTENHCRPATLRDVVNETSEGKPTTFASWFTGLLRAPDGAQIVSVNMGYGSVYERDVIFDVRAGIVSEPTITDNTERTLPSEMELTKAELEKLRIWETGETETPADSTKHLKSDEPIIAGVGWSRIIRGATRKNVEVLLGKGEGDERNPNLKDVYFREYKQNGIQVSYKQATDRVEAIFFYNGQRLDPGYVTPFLRTEKGIDWNSSPKDVLTAYGEPVGDFGGPNPRGTWRRIEFKGIDFRFENDILVRISVIQLR